MDDKELGRMLRLEKVEENTFPEEKTKEIGRASCRERVS